MKYLNVELSQPDRMLHPMQQFIRDTDVVRYEELRAWNIDARDPKIEYELFYVEADREPYEEKLDRVDSVRWYDLTPVDEHSFYLYVCQETRNEDINWREAFTTLNLVVVPPIVYDSTAAFTMTVVGTGENLQAMLESLPDEIDVTVQEIGEYDHRYAPLTGDLTDRQLEAVGVAADVGYFEVPREAGVDEVAAVLGCASSTAATLLQKAQARVMRRLVQRDGRKRDSDGPGLQSG